MNVKEIRRHNLRALAKEVGGITAIAKKLEKSQSQISHLIGIKPIKNIGDKLAAHVEQVFNKPTGWLDKEHPEIMRQLGVEVSSDRRGYTQWIPIIHWQQLPDWPHQTDSVIHLVHEYVPVSLTMGRNAFALRIEESDIADHPQINVQNGTIYIIDPTRAPRDGDIIILSINNFESIAVMQYMNENAQSATLKSLKEPGKIIPYQQPAHAIVGVIRQLIINLDQES